jgi:tRNA pseudouridine38-40 synthase
MRNIRLLIEYDGTDYSGWQVQPGIPTVQQELLNAIWMITGEWVNLIGAGRTDAGVHAEGQVANFRTEARISAEQFPFALNSGLPEDVVVKEAAEVPLEFHAQFDAVGKTYRYLIWNSRIRPALNRYRQAWVKAPLELEKMREAAGFLVGTHDFQSFASECREKDSVRTVSRLELERDGELISMEVSADGFLYNMVRAIAGTLIDVGRVHLPVSAVPEMLAAKDRRQGGPTAPACGLCLVRVDY